MAVWMFVRSRRFAATTGFALDRIIPEGMIAYVRKVNPERIAKRRRRRRLAHWVGSGRFLVVKSASVSPKRGSDSNAIGALGNACVRPDSTN